MPIAAVQELPAFDTGEFAGDTFSLAGGGAELAVHIDGAEDVVLSFTRLRWHEFTALYNCTPEQVETAYFKLIEIEASQHMAAYVASARASARAYSQLRHFRIFLDEHGCHELFAESFTVKRRRSERVRSGA